MKILLLMVGLSIATAAGGYLGYYRTATAPTQTMLARADGEMEWLRRQFQFSDTQFSEVKKLHDQYAPTCEAMCVQIARANERLDQLISANRNVTPEIEAALKHCEAVQEQCRQAMLGHVYAVAAKMPRDQGERYIQMMKTRIIEPPLSHDAVISRSAK